MLSKRSAIAVGAVATLAITQAPRPAEANPAIALPAACATGVGCVLLGTVIIGGAVYYIWQNRSTGRRYQIPVEGYGPARVVPQDRDDRDAEGRQWDDGSSGAFYARSYREALQRCRARGYRRVSVHREVAGPEGRSNRYYVCHSR